MTSTAWQSTLKYAWSRTFGGNVSWEQLVRLLSTFQNLIDFSCWKVLQGRWQMLEPRANSPCLFLPLYEGINRSATWHPERRSSPSPGFNDYPEERAFMPYSERELATLASSGVQGKGAEEAREICLRPGCIVLGSHSADSPNSVNSFSV